MSIIILIALIFLLVLILPGIVAGVSKKQANLVRGLVYLAVILIVSMCLNKYFIQKEGFVETTPPNSSVVFNTGGPAWGQFVISPSLIPARIFIYPSNFNVTSDGSIIGNSFMAGEISITPRYKNNRDSMYKDAETYYLGDLVVFNGKKTYMNLAWPDPRGPEYSGSHKSSPEKDRNVWKEVFIKMIPSPDLIHNYGGPEWGQFTWKQSLVKDSIDLNGAFTLGGQTYNTSKTIRPYQDADTYYLGDLVSFEGSNYINLAYKDPRGPTYAGSHKSSPMKDTNVWKKIKVCS
jgi:hypothetical protein